MCAPTHRRETNGFISTVAHLTGILTDGALCFAPDLRGIRILSKVAGALPVWIPTGEKTCGKFPTLCGSSQKNASRKAWYPNSRLFGEDILHERKAPLKRPPPKLKKSFISKTKAALVAIPQFFSIVERKLRQCTAAKLQKFWEL